MKPLLHPTYFPNIAHFAVLTQTQTVCWELCDNYQKQTLRNRTLIYTANGGLTLSVPVLYSQNNRQHYKDVKIAYTENWQSHHWKSLLSAYRMSPFFEFYEDDLRPLFKNRPTFLLDHNLKCFDIICSCLQLEIKTLTTKTFEKKPTTIKDYRMLANTKKLQLQPFEKYTQVFGDKHGFISNLSILDLIFNEGPNTINYLQEQCIVVV